MQLLGSDTMEIIKRDTAKKIEYFDLFDFISQIKLTPKVLNHMEETNMHFDEYFRKLSKYDDEFVLYFWISLAYEEIKNNHFVENHSFSKFDLSVRNLFFDKTCVNHDRIHNIHKFVMRGQTDDRIGKYRENEVRVSHIEKNKEEIFWYGAQAEDINKFMDNFLEVYQTNTMSVLNSNPFLKSALIHLLLVKIQPYFDGNRRTARTLHNIKFTEMINKTYGMDLDICPVNLSESIHVNLISYINAIHNIYFDLEHDNNEMLNYWFNFILNMYDEQLFNKQNMINDVDNVIERILKVKERINPEIIEKVSKTRIRKK